MKTTAHEPFAQARELEPAAERDAFLAQSCGDNAELHLEVQRLFVDAARANSFFGDAKMEKGVKKGVSAKKGSVCKS